MANLAVCTLAAQPDNPAILYAGTGEGYYNGDAARGAGVFKSVNSGVTWDRLASTNTPDFYFVNRIVVSGDNVSVVYAATRTGLWKSVDAGSSWSKVFDGNIMDLVVKGLSGTEAVYCWKADDGLYRTQDGGQQFVKVWSLLSQPWRGALAVSASGDRLYLAVAPYGGDLLGVYRSDDSAASWTSVSIPQNAGDQGWYDLVLSVDPTNSARVWLGVVGLFRSDDAGQTWSSQSGGHSDYHAITFDPGYDGAANQTVLIGNDGGIYRSTNAAAAAAEVTFSSLNNGYGVTQFYHGATSPTGPVYIGGTQDNGTLRFDGSSATGNWNRIYGGDGGYCAIDSSNPDVMYYETQAFRFLKSTDGGLVESSSSNGIPNDEQFLFIPPFAMDPADSSRLWIGGLRPWRSLDSAASWTSASGSSSLGTSRISAFGIAPSGAGQVVYVGTSGGELFRTTDALSETATWTKVRDIYSRITGIAVHPTNPDIAYITIGSFGPTTIFRSPDGGATWSELQGSGSTALPLIPAHCVAIHPNLPSRVYVGTDAGVFASEDQGTNWTNVNTPGLANTVVHALVFQGNSKLFAFSHGRGAFVGDVGAQPSLNILSMKSERGTCSVGQTFLCTVRVGLDGNPSTIHQAQLTVGNSRLVVPPLNVTQSLGATVSETDLTFFVTAEAVGTSSLTSATFVATEDGSGASVPVGRNLAPSVPIQAQSAATLRVDEVILSRASVSRGQTGLTVRVRVTNTGGADAAALTGLTASLRFDGEAVGYIVRESPPARVRFVFDSKDETNNAYRGWYVDDVVVRRTSEPPPSSPDGQNLFADEFEAGAAGWSEEGLWHQVVGGGTYSESHSPIHAWWYGQESTGNYETGARTTGSLVSPKLSLSDGAYLFFWSWSQTEGGAWDTRTVELSRDDGQTWGSLEANVPNESNWNLVSVSLGTGAASNATSLAAGQTTVLTYTVDVATDAPLGETLVTAEVGAADANTAAAAAVTNAAEARWVVQTPAVLVVE
ncbi:MAG: hypothetical protein HYY25_04760, partial [Candidatus Wallbacteria bacterium]|nr:hypothetical protein [Candidatus Wallbacteria bacterium]